MPSHRSKKKSRLRRRGKRALQPFTSTTTTTTPATTPTTAPIQVQSPKKEAENPTPKIVATNISPANKEKIGRLFGSIHRSSNLAQKSTQSQTEKRDKAYTPTQIEEAWYRFVSHIPEQADLHFLFGKAPKYQNHTLTVEIDNSVVLNKMQVLLQRLTIYLRNAVENDYITIELKEVEGKVQPRTPREKARAMNESNGNLMKLFTSWGLRLT